ncbi:MAG: hypothetical protein JRE23_02965, partial [Deltaproteobacteria bacterium]|nr:hypothetical protein [Deltaproteobacteria bacterium]
RAAELLGGKKIAVPSPARASRQAMGKTECPEVNPESEKSETATIAIPTVQSMRDPTRSEIAPEMGDTKKRKTNGITRINPTLLTGKPHGSNK